MKLIKSNNNIPTYCKVYIPHNYTYVYVYKYTPNIVIESDIYLKCTTKLSDITKHP